MRCLRRAWLGAGAVLLLLTAASRAEPGTTDPAEAARSIGPWGTPPEEFGALAFTADGSFVSVWKYASKTEAEAKVLGDCARLRRGLCEVVSFQAELCAAIASLRAASGAVVTYSGGGMSREEAQKKALARCNLDGRAGGTCVVRTVLCGDGR